MRSLLRPWHSLTRSPLRRALSIGGAALAVVGWLTLAPVALGGSSTFVTTYGTSMEPTLHRGDLAIVRAQPSYLVGDVVAYRSDSLHAVVLHRIIGRDGDRFVFKGDNNTWTDTDHPTTRALIGKMEMRLPGVGTHVQRAASPPGIATLAGVAALPVATKGRRRRGTNKAGSAKPGAPPRSWPMWGSVEPRMLVATAVGLSILALAFTRPPTIHSSSDLPFDDQGEFSYTGAAPGGSAVYQADHVPSGQPIFLNLVDQVDFAFTYRASATAALVAEGDLSFTGMVTDATGWTYPFDLADPVHFSGDEARTTGTLDLSDLQATIAGMETATGVARDTYTVLVQASVNRDVHRNDAMSSGVFTATLEFELNELEMHLASPGGDTLTPSQGGLLSVPLERQNHIDLLGQSLSIAALRAVALALSLIIAALWIDWLARTTRGDETSLIERRYRSYLLPVRGADLAPGPVIDVESIATLARLADHTGAPMLRDEGGGYHVIDGPRVYRYTVDANEGRHDELPEQELSQT